MQNPKRIIMQWVGIGTNKQTFKSENRKEHFHILIKDETNSFKQEMVKKKIEKFKRLKSINESRTLS